MIKFSKERARAAGMLRKSEEHGKDEWRAILSESFLKKNEKIQEKEQQASEVLEARVHNIYIYIYYIDHMTKVN